MDSCIRACQSCHEVCLGTIRHCLEKGGSHAASDHIGMLQDCAQICQTSADFMLRGSHLHAHTCGACAAVCEACATHCEAMADDRMMEECAEACRRCAEECAAMSAH